jgi:hypothetical protein
MLRAYTGENLAIAEKQDENRPMAEKKRWSKCSDADFGKIFRVSKSFQRSRNVKSFAHVQFVHVQKVRI